MAVTSSSVRPGRSPSSSPSWNYTFSPGARHGPCRTNRMPPSWPVAWMWRGL